MQVVKTKRKAQELYGKEALSYTVTSRELVWQVPTAARVSGCIFRDSVPKTL